MRLNWTDEKIEKVKEIVESYLISSEAFSGEVVCQSDKCQIDAIHELASPLADVFENDEHWKGLFD